MKKLLCLLLALSLCFGFAACGEKEAVEESVAEKLVIGYTIYEPMNYMEDGKLTGFDTEFAEAVCEKLGVEPEFVEINWDTKFVTLDSNKIDCIWNGMTISDEVKANCDVSKAYVKNAQVVVMKEDVIADYADVESLKGLKFAAEAGSAGETYLKDFDGANYKGCPKQTDCLTEVNAMTADFAVLDAQLAKSYCGKGDYADLMIVEDLSSDVEYYAIGFKKGSELTAKVNEQLVKLAKDGTIKKIAEKYDVLNTTILDYADQVK